MSRNTYCSPSLVLDNKEIEDGFTASIDMRGNSTITTCKITVNGNDLKDYKLFNKEVKVYMNLGSIDSVPIFRGYIKTVSPSVGKVGLSCLDARTFIHGGDSLKVTLSDSSNYDGYTLTQFLTKWIKDKVNIGKTYIGTDMIRETDPPLSMFAMRSENADVYDIVKKGVVQARREEDIIPQSYEIVMVDDGNKSNICFLKEKSLKAPPSLRLGYDDGLVNVSYKKEPLPNYAIVGEARYEIGNKPNGPIALKSKYLPNLSDYSESPANVAQSVLSELERQRVYNAKKINIETSKGHYVAIGDTVFLDVDDPDIRGVHKVTSKKLAIGSSKMNVNLTLNKRIETLDDIF